MGHSRRQGTTPTTTTVSVSDKTSRLREVEVEVEVRVTVGVAVEVAVAVEDGDKGFRVEMDPAPSRTTITRLDVSNLSRHNLGLMLRGHLTERRRHKLAMA
jgi:hypothetical protein